jgi:hypothetical protein
LQIVDATAKIKKLSSQAFDMDYTTLDRLRQTHPAWRLLKADNAVLIISFLYRTFVKPNVRSLSEAELGFKLDDYLFHLRRDQGQDSFPREANAYLEDWASDKHGWLRKYYPDGNDEPAFDITPSTEQALDWLASLNRRPFIGTESRLVMLIELLRQLADGTDPDPKARLAELKRRRAEIDAEIARVEKGALTMIGATGVRERFIQIAENARALLSDFRAVESNFRELDRQAREKIATWEGGKGALIDEILGDRDLISDSDQGRSFRAFWDFLMSPERQEELSQLTARVFELDPVKELGPDRQFLRIHYDWLAAGEITQRTVARLSAELRRFLDDKAWLENRRIMEILRDIETCAIELRDEPPEGAVMAIDGLNPSIRLVMDRPLFTPPTRPAITSTIEPSNIEDMSADALFDSIHVDKEILMDHIRRLLIGRRQVSLAEITLSQPLQHGLAELVAYLAIAGQDSSAIVDPQKRESITWEDETGRHRMASVPLVIFSRSSSMAEADGSME